MGSSTETSSIMTFPSLWERGAPWGIFRGRTKVKHILTIHKNLGTSVFTSIVRSRASYTMGIFNCDICNCKCATSKYQGKHKKAAPENAHQLR